MDNEYHPEEGIITSHHIIVEFYTELHSYVIIIGRQYEYIFITKLGTKETQGCIYIDITE